MRRRTMAAAVVLAVALGTLAAGPATARPDWRWDQCRFQYADGEKGLSPEEVRLTLRCAEDRWTAPGGIAQVFEVVGCESGFREDADNPNSSAGGVWQVIDSTWASWRARFAAFAQRWHLRPGKYNGRANSILGLRIASADGYGAWAPSSWCWAD